jgi:hypothetical protein
MTAVAKLDIIIPKGGTYRLVVNVVGGPVDLTGYTGAMQIRKYKESDEVLAEVDTGDIDVDSGNRQVVVTIPSIDTATYDFDSGVYDVLLQGPSDDWRIVEGNVRISGSVTREP